MKELEKTELIRKAKAMYMESGDKRGFILDDGTFFNIDDHKNICKLWKSTKCEEMDVITFQKTTQAIRVNDDSVQIHQDTPITNSQKRRLINQCEERIFRKNDIQLFVDVVNDDYKVVDIYSYEILDCKRSLGDFFRQFQSKRIKK